MTTGTDDVQPAPDAEEGVITADEALLESLGLTVDEAALAAADLPAVYHPNRADRRARFRGQPGKHRGSKKRKVRGRPELGRDDIVFRHRLRVAIAELEAEKAQEATTPDDQNGQASTDGMPEKPEA